MAYTPLNWQSGDIVTAEKLNQMKGGVLIITPVEEGGVISLGYSYNDIMAMLGDNIFPMLRGSQGDAYSFDRMQGYEIYEGTYSVYFSNIDFVAESATDILTASN